ncbi:MAG: hypothetical protein M3024_04600 [Candidatus Dormibacteraeota bacterium]|nr:hypothetical protein [Candidatus Dormibacteraeota bacterium]
MVGTALIAVAGCGPFCSNSASHPRQLSAKEIALQKNDLPSGWTVDVARNGAVAVFAPELPPQTVVDAAGVSYSSSDQNTTVVSDGIRFATADNAAAVVLT